MNVQSVGEDVDEKTPVTIKVANYRGRHVLGIVPNVSRM